MIAAVPEKRAGLPLIPIAAFWLGISVFAFVGRSVAVFAVLFAASCCGVACLLFKKQEAKQDVAQ